MQTNTLALIMNDKGGRSCFDMSPVSFINLDDDAKLDALVNVQDVEVVIKTVMVYNPDEEEFAIFAYHFRF